MFAYGADAAVIDERRWTPGSLPFHRERTPPLALHRSHS